MIECNVTYDVTFLRWGQCGRRQGRVDVRLGQTPWWRGSLHSWVLWTRPLCPPGATQRLVQSVQGLSKKHNLDKYTSRANDACISDYFTKSEFSAKARRERVEKIKLFLVSEFQIPAKANRGPEENLKKRDTKLIPRQSPQRQQRYEKKIVQLCPTITSYKIISCLQLSNSCTIWWRTSRESQQETQSWSQDKVHRDPQSRRWSPTKSSLATSRILERK